MSLGAISIAQEKEAGTEGLDNEDQRNGANLGKIHEAKCTGGRLWRGGRRYKGLLA